MLSVIESVLLLTSIFSTVYVLNHIYLKKTKKYNAKVLHQNVMGTILILFGILKLYDIQKFVNIFQKYDLISNKIPQYAYLYPFIEIALGMAYLQKIKLHTTDIITMLVMIISIISVFLSIISGKKLRCGCMGSFFHIPLSYVTLSENFIMLYFVIKKYYNLKI